MKPILFGLLSMLCMLSANSASSKAILVEPHIHGQVIAVDENGVLVVKPSRILLANKLPFEESLSMDQNIYVREWGAEISQQDMELMVLGREVVCVLVYKTQSHHGGHCYINFFEDYLDRPSQNDLPFFYRDNDIAIKDYMEHFGIGRFVCNEEDRENQSNSTRLHAKIPCD